MKQLSGVKNVAVISLGWLGDTLLNSSLCDNIKLNFPEAKLMFIASKPFVEVARGIKSVDEIFYIDKKIEHKGFGGVFKFADKFSSRGKIDVAFVTHAHERSILLAKAIGAKRVVALPKKGFNPINSLITHKFNRSLCELKNTYQADFNADYLTALNLPVKKLDVSFSYPDSYDEVIADKLQQANFTFGEYVVFSPTSKDDYKDLDIEFVEQFIKNSNKPVVLIGTDKAHALLARLSHLDFIDMTNKTTIFELGALCKNAASTVTVDTGTMHIAYAVGVKTVCLFYKIDMVRQWLPIERENVYLLECSRDDVDQDVAKTIELCN